MGKKSSIRIGTRSSPLALWQARQVQQRINYASELVSIQSSGDIDLITPVYAMNIQGVFTKALDKALLNHQIDIAVHSLKDIPTQLAEGLEIFAVLERETPWDVVAHQGEWDHLKEKKNLVVATGSLRRKAQWLHQHPQHRIVSLRGNIQTRLAKVYERDIDAVIISEAALKRLEIDERIFRPHWLLPAPAQGVVAVVGRAGDRDIYQECRLMHHSDTALLTQIERNFLQYLGGGCAQPIAALATIAGEEIRFRAWVTEPDGKRQYQLYWIEPWAQHTSLAQRAAQALLKNIDTSVLKT